MSAARWLPGLTALLALFVFVFSLQHALDNLRHRADEPDLTLPSGRFMKVAALGYRQLAADFFWVKATLYIGDAGRAARRYPQLYDLADLVTDLDPKFRVPYHAAGIVLSVYAERPEESIRILKKGMREHPDNWAFPFYVGFNYFYHLHDHLTAARFLEQASTLPNRPTYLPALVSRLYAQAGQPETALEFLGRMYERAQDERSREALTQRIKQVLVERDLQVLERAVAQYRQRHRTLPMRLDDLVHDGLMTHIPPDPFGGVYRLDLATGAVTTTTPIERLKVYRR